MFRKPTLLRLQREFLSRLEQRKKLGLYESFVSGLDIFLTFCERARRDFLNGARVLETDFERIHWSAVVFRFNVDQLAANAYRRQSLPYRWKVVP